MNPVRTVCRRHPGVLALGTLIVASASLAVPAQAAAIAFTETFDSYSPGTIFSSSELVKVAGPGTPKVYEDHGGSGTTPSILLFPGIDAPVHFLNLNNVKIGTTQGYGEAYQTLGVACTLDLVASLQNADPANPFAITSNGFIEIHLRENTQTSANGLILRAYATGGISVWEGSVSTANLKATYSNSGINSNAPFGLSLVDNGSSIAININGSLFKTYSSTYGNTNAGYITLGNSSYEGIKIDTLSIAVPEPASMALLSSGMILIGLPRRVRRA